MHRLTRLPHIQKLSKPAAMMALSLLMAGSALIAMGGVEQAPAKERYTLNNYINSAQEPRILEAFKLLADSSGEKSLTIIVNRPIRVIFKDLATLDKRVKDYDALSYMTANGQLMIYINQKHADAPPAALAAILSHEALHNDMQNSLSEEVAGWTQEAKVWHELKQKDGKLQAYVKGQSALVDRLNTLDEHLKAGNLVSFVRSQAAYKGLPESSPGYADTVAISPDEKTQ
ncbi:MAG: hypothetical protein VKJ04_06485 [Vampirovibrionales bacterium]|nr:hypothetical protein [Vampirovibrionales bacterium]